MHIVRDFELSPKWDAFFKPFLSRLRAPVQEGDGGLQGKSVFQTQDAHMSSETVAACTGPERLKPDSVTMLR